MSSRSRDGGMRYAQANDIRRLFLFAFERAAARLNSADLYTIHRTPPGRIEDLRWLTPEAVAAVERHLDLLARRPSAHRFSLDGISRKHLLAALGGRSALEDARKMFVLAALVDKTFRWPPEADDTNAERIRHRVIGVPQRFFAGIANPPPSLGQMTGVSICQRWMTNLWVVGDLRAARGFGTLPPMEWQRAAGRLRNRLEEACNKGVLRIAAVAWWLPEEAQIRFHDTEEGCFAVAGFAKPVLPSTVDTVLAYPMHLG